MNTEMEARTGLEPIIEAYETSVIPFHHLANLVLIVEIESTTFSLQMNCSAY